MTDKDRQNEASGQEPQAAEPVPSEQELRAEAHAAVDLAQASLATGLVHAGECVTQAVLADLATAPPDRPAPGPVSATLVECLAEVNEGHARSVAALNAVRQTIDGASLDLDAHKKALEEQRDAIDGALSRLPENRAYLDSVGKASVSQLDKNGRQGLYIHLRRRLLDAIAEGYCKDRGVSSVSELTDDDKAELQKRQTEAERQW